mgnify:CR=1 FL=1
MISDHFDANKAEPLGGAEFQTRPPHQSHTLTGGASQRAFANPLQENLFMKDMSPQNPYLVNTQPTWQPPV